MPFIRVIYCVQMKMFLIMMSFQISKISFEYFIFSETILLFGSVAIGSNGGRVKRDWWMSLFSRLESNDFFISAMETAIAQGEEAYRR